MPTVVPDSPFAVSRGSLTPTHEVSCPGASLREVYARAFPDLACVSLHDAPVISVPVGGYASDDPRA